MTQNLIINGNFTQPLPPEWIANMVGQDEILGRPSVIFAPQGSLTQIITPPLPVNVGLLQLDFDVFVQVQGAGLSVVAIVDIPMDDRIILTAVPTTPNIFTHFSVVFSAGLGILDLVEAIAFINNQAVGNVWLLNVILVKVGGEICYAGESKILARNTLTNKINTTNAEDIISGTHEVFNVTTKSFVPVKLNIVTGLVNKYMLIKKNILGKNQPSDDFYVTAGHMIMLNGKEVKAKDIPHAIKVSVLPQKVYSVCTDQRCPILVNNLSVMTWGYDKWIASPKSKRISWINNTITKPDSKPLQKTPIKTNLFIRPKKYSNNKQYNIFQKNTLSKL